MGKPTVKDRQQIGAGSMASMGLLPVHGVIKYDGPRCGAKTRTGAPCENIPVASRRRCRMHGGASLRGIASPRFKHGRYCKDLFAQLAGAYLFYSAEDRQ